MATSRKETAILNLLTLFVSVLALVMFVPPVAQSTHYHDFADATTMFGIANFLNVASNLSFLVAGVLGLAFLRRSDVHASGVTFSSSGEWYPYFVFFLGVTLTAFGSGYYHYNPSNETLIWDRLPMTIMFMGLFSAVIAERINTRAGLQLCLPLVIFGIGTVVNWAVTERMGQGDLRLYAIVQFFPMLALPIILYLFPPRYTKQHLLLLSLGWYVLAKVFESTDGFFYHAIGVSGHTIKHLLCGVSAYCIYKMLKERTPVAIAPSKPD